MSGRPFASLVCLLGCCMAQTLPDHISLLQLRVAKFAPTRSASRSACDGDLANVSDCALEVNGSSSNESRSSGVMRGISKDSSISDEDSNIDINSSAEAPVAIADSSDAEQDSDNDEDSNGNHSSSAKAPPSHSIAPAAHPASKHATHAISKHAAHPVVDSTADKEQTGTEDMLTVYIQFGKVGSSSMRNVLEFRAARHGWPVVDPDAPCHKHGITGSVCEDRKEAECARAKEQGLPCGMRLCKNEDKPSGASTTALFSVNASSAPSCANEPADSVVLATYYGLCDSVKRPCQYVTLLREPVARVISSYNYWCLDCLDHVDGRGIFCNKHDKCPDDMTITEWATRHGNDYTRRLATRKGRETLSDGFYGNDGFLDEVELTEKDFEYALGIVQADNMLPLSIETFTACTEEQTGCTQDQTGLEKLAKFVGDKTIVSNKLNDVTETNTHEHKYLPTDAEVAELKQILDYDIRLYEAVIVK